MKEDEIATRVIDVSMTIHKKLGPGLLESVYETILAYELEKTRLKVQKQASLPVNWDGMVIDNGYRADIIVEHLVILELKSVESLQPVFGKQLLTYLKLTNLRLGLLINFGSAFLKDGIKRVVHGLPE